MAGNHIGGIKAAITTKERHGYNFYSEAGRLGGKVPRKRGFSLDRDLAVRAGRIGGLNSSKSRRGKEPV